MPFVRTLSLSLFLLFCVSLTVNKLSQNGNKEFRKVRTEFTDVSTSMNITQNIVPIKSPSKNKIRQKNLVFVKTHKTGGSTLSGVLRHIAYKSNLTGFTDNDWIKDEPGVWANHNEYYRLHLNITRLKKPVFMVTILRKPVERALSGFFFGRVLMNLQKQPSVKTINEFMLNKAKRNYFFNYIRSRKNEPVQALVKRFDLIFITERFDESLIVLKQMCNLDFNDILYIKSKESNTSTWAKKQRGKNVKIRNPGPSVLSEDISKAFRKLNKLDYELYNEANKTLDRKIKSIKNFSKQLRYFQAYQRAVLKKCEDVFNRFEDCFTRDFGCGRSCIHNVTIENFEEFA